MKYVVHLIRESTESRLYFFIKISEECPDFVEEILKHIESVYGYEWELEYYYVGCHQ